MIELILVACGFWLLKLVVGTLLAQQLKGSIPEFAARKAKAAARRLPNDLGPAYEEDWLSELEALADKPISALRYAHGLSKASRSISSAVGGVLLGR